MNAPLTNDDRRIVTELLGREPQGDFEIAVRHRDGTPLVIANAPFLDDGTPMPTRWWLVGEPERTRVGRLESTGAVDRAESEIDEERLAAAHARYGAERDALIPADHRGPRPSGGVGGTRTGVKCLHAHYAWWLAGGDDPVGAWVADELRKVGFTADVGSSGDADAVAGIDCGTNSTRLLIARPIRGGGFETLVRRMHITRLGQGVDATGRLDPQAVARTVDVLGEYRREMDRFGVRKVRATATSAARDARNRDELFGPVSQELGIELELLSGAEEAALSFAGATFDLASQPGRYLIVDIGGGSTELAAGVIRDDGIAEVWGATSVDIGCVRITERFLSSDPPGPDELAAATRYCDAVLDEAMSGVAGAADAQILVGLAGTVSSLASIDLGLAPAEHARGHHHVLGASRIAELSASLLAMSTSQRCEIEGMEPGRAAVLAGGLVVLGSLMTRTAKSSLLVSEADILDGLAASASRS